MSTQSTHLAKMDNLAPHLQTCLREEIADLESVEESLSAIAEQIRDQQGELALGRLQSILRDSIQPAIASLSSLATDLAAKPKRSRSSDRPRRRVRS